MLGAFGSGTTWDPLPDTIIAGDGNYHTIMWCPSARWRDPDENQRNRQTVYLKGFRDVFTCRTPNAVVFLWRRIVFTSHIKYTQALANNGTKTYYRNMNVDQSQALSMIEDLLAGKNGQDWVDPVNGKVDTRINKLISDKTRYIRPDGAFGDIKTFKMYYPLNTNFTYDDEEQAGGEESDPWASGGRAAGNVYVIDMFKSNIGTQANAALNIKAQGTLYWHEK